MKTLEAESIQPTIETPAAADPWQIIPPARDMSIEGILSRLTAALDEQARQIEVIKSLL
jgi:hypothetical protein